MISFLRGAIPLPRLLPWAGAANDGAKTSAPEDPASHDQGSPAARALYQQLAGAVRLENAGARREAARLFLDHRLQVAASLPCDLPKDAQGLEAWMKTGVARTGKLYQDYLQRRVDGGGREYFHCRSHALGVLRAIAPTKLADGAWLSGMLSHAGDPCFAELIRTYLEELGDGAPDKNHVLLYRRLLQAHGVDDWLAQSDECFEQGAIQLALGACTQDFLPEVIGFNLGYEQLPLHLLISAYELDELGIDPYYFTLHVTVDNAASGHAMRAVKAVHDALSRTDASAVFWERVRRGYLLGNLGLSTNAAITRFDLDAEFLRVLGQKTFEGRFAHSNYCRIEGKTVNEWLGSAQGVDGFVQALHRKGWLTRGVDPRASRFWQLLHGEQAQMHGVFGAYERQVIYDWIRGPASGDGARAPSSVTPDQAPRPCRPYRHQRGALTAAEAGLTQCVQLGAPPADPEVTDLTVRLEAAPDPEARLVILRDMMGPDLHWTRAGLCATRIFRRAVLGADEAHT
ncbi:iron-containing redox enzyme family protein [Variovorax sp. J22P271]|uniref:iron-containing redox enzyme family protein n=1 Tax=Variovorax davisae TaxID=3053515 RepID=UPI002575F73D|nr:iron-containing redox enzyme family protein [Variovorax sp. J22P271]MDM0032139.1 iron-containing redox enzyme family protein [Variovorax sp. J22P271]